MAARMQDRIRDILEPVARDIAVDDIRIGLKYTSAHLDTGQCGVSWTGRDSGACCGQNPRQKTLAGRGAVEILDLLASPTAQQRSVGLATANALAAVMPAPEASTTDILDILHIDQNDHVVMVGFFGPLMSPLRQTGCRLEVLELNERPGTIPPQDGQEALARCSVAIITSTAIVTDTIDDLLAQLGAPRATVMLGPSTFMRPEVYAGTPVTHLAGARVLDAADVARSVSEGGGTQILKRSLRFETIQLAG